MRPWSTASLLARDVRDPLSLGSVHVAREADLRAVGPWSRAALYAVVEAAAPLERLVVLDYGREHLYVAADATRERDGPPVVGDVRLRVADPLLATVGDGDPPAVALAEHGSAVAVTPPFDVLVPAFDLSADDEALPPSTDPGPDTRPTGLGTGTPS